MLVAFAPGQVSAGLLNSAKSSNPQRHGVVAAVWCPFPRLHAGTVLVQFIRARLSYVLPSTRAISYPIATPTGDARWTGKTYVSAKRVNPSGTPTADMRRKTPIFPPMCPEATHKTRSAFGLCISARAFTGSTAPMRPGQWGRRSTMAASASSIRTLRISTNGPP